MRHGGLELLPAILLLATPATPQGGDADALAVTVSGTVHAVESPTGVAEVVGTTGQFLPHLGLARNAAGTYLTTARSHPLADVFALITVDPSTGAG